MQNKKIIVTAGTDGLGRATVEAFAREGAIVATCARRQEKLDELQEQLGANVITAQADLHDGAATKNFVSDSITKLGGLDCLVFNPPHSVKKQISALSLEDWQASYESILGGMIATVHEAMPSLMKNKGSVVVISSIAAIQPIDIMPPSSVFRGGVAAWLKLMAREYGANGVRFNAVQPGFTDTPAVRGSLQKMAVTQNKSVDQVAAELSENVALKRLGRPQEVAEVVLFLASERASYITGTNILVDGGLSRGV